MSKKLEEKIALVTGGSTGISFASGQRFAVGGAYVFITGRRQEELDDAATKIGCNVTGVGGDAGSFADLDQLFSIIEQDKGRLDIVRRDRRLGIRPVHRRQTRERSPRRHLLLLPPTCQG